jgi:pantoate--beta-alanine ligase
VATIVAKLLNAVEPDAAYFGQKDWQQAVIVRRMTRDLDFPTEIIVGPTVRDPDGLALSSRNAYLSPAERAWAPRLYQALGAAAAEARLPGRSPDDLKRMVEARLGETPMTIQYVEVLRAADLAPVETLAGEIVIAAAVHLGTTRLIDNILVEIPA